MRFMAISLAAGMLVAVPVAAGYTSKPPAAKKPGAASKSTAKYDEAKLKELEAKLKKNPKDAKLKAEVAEASYQVGHYIEYDKPGLAPREKYRPALKLYNRALELNPKHAQAKKEKDQIEQIYKQMGMPIPK